MKVKNIINKYGNFNGRASRSEFWIQLFILNSVVILGLLLNNSIGYFVSILTFIPIHAVFYRRMHDIGKAGWYSLIPVYCYVLACFKGDPNDNESGENPLNEKVIIVKTPEFTDELNNLNKDDYEIIEVIPKFQGIFKFIKEYILINTVLVVFIMIFNNAFLSSFIIPTSSMENTILTGDYILVNKFIFGPTTPQVIPFINQPLPFYQFPGYRKPKLNDVIVFIYPGDRDELKPRVFNYYLKRCCGTPGDVVQVKNKQLFVNGKQIPLAKKGQLTEFSFDPVAGFPYNAGYTRDNWGPFKIPKAGEIIEITPQNIAQWAVFVKREGHEISFGNGSVLIDGKPTTKYKVEKNYYFGMGDNRDNSEDSRSWGLIPEENIVGTPIMVYWSWNTDLPINEFFGKIASVRWDRLGTFIR